MTNPPKHIPESRIALNPVVIDDSKRGNPPGWNEIEPIPDDDPLKRWKASPRPNQNPQKKHTGAEFIEDVIR